MKYFLVHGTFDTDDSAEGERWWQKDSLFCQKLTQHVAEEDITRIVWNGHNSQRQREVSGRNLCGLIDRMTDENGPEITVVCHSHGGNLALHGLKSLDPKKAKLVRLVTVGTPFIQYKFRNNIFESNLLTVFSLLMWSVCIGLIFNQISLVFFDFEFSDISLFSAGLLVASFWFIPFLILYLTMAVPDILKKYSVSTTVISHPDDEAVTGLMYAVNNQFNPFDAKGVSARIYSAFLTVEAVLYVLLLPVAILLSTYFLVWPTGEQTLQERMSENYQLLWVGPAMVFFVWALFKAFFWPLRQAMSRVASGTLARGLNSVFNAAKNVFAVGSDSFATIEHVSKFPDVSHQEVQLPDEIVTQMNKETSTKAADRIQGIKLNLTRHLQSKRDPLSSLVEIFEWNELIHTYYFRHPECCQFIVDTVVGQATRRYPAREVKA